MTKVQTIEEFYSRKINWMPENLKKEIGHFNVFHTKDFVGPQAKAPPYNRKKYFKISLLLGRNRFHYADKPSRSKRMHSFSAMPKSPIFGNH